MQIPILKGVYVDSQGKLGATYPINMYASIEQTDINAGYLRVVDGARFLQNGLGLSRGGIRWNNALYRVSGTRLVLVAQNGALTELATVPAGGQVSMAYSFDRLAIVTDQKLFYWNGTTLSQVTDPDLGLPIAVIWVDGYFVLTDGRHLVVTELNDPMQINPLKYGSSEIDPDSIVTVLKLRNEVVAVNRFTIEFFRNVGTHMFPFQRVEGAQIQKGAFGPHAACVYEDAIAFLGGGRNDAPGIYLGVNGSSVKISTTAIDAILARNTEVELSTVILQTYNFEGRTLLWVRLPDRTLVYDLSVSKAFNVPVWYQLTTAKTGFSRYRVIDPIWCYNQWCVCDAQTGNMGIMTSDSARVFGDIVYWDFSTSIIYNKGKGALWQQLELVAITGRIEENDNPTIATSYSLDGTTWSQERPISIGNLGNRNRRLVWYQQGMMRNWRIQKFIGDSRSRISVLRLEAKLEPLEV